MKNFTVLVLIFLFTACSENEERFKRISYLSSVNEGDSPNEVVYKMQANPDKIIFSDSTYSWQEPVYDLTTFIYFTPRGASSNIHIYFKDCEVFYISYD